MKILPRSKIPEALFHFLKESIEDSNDCIPNQVFQVSGCLPKRPKILTQFYAAVPDVQESVEIRTNVLLPQKNKTLTISAGSPLFASFCALLC